MKNDKVAMQRQTAVSDRLRHHQFPAGSASKRSGMSSWLLICAIGLVLVVATVVLHSSSDRQSPAVQDYVHIVTTNPGQKGRPTIYNYEVASKTTPSPGGGVALVSDIDDSSSEAAYQRSCLASLMREKNPEIMALSEAAREDMCTDPRR